MEHPKQMFKLIYKDHLISSNNIMKLNISITKYFMFQPISIKFVLQVFVWKCLFFKTDLLFDERCPLIINYVLYSLFYCIFLFQVDKGTLLNEVGESMSGFASKV